MHRAGGLGFLAAGYISPQRVADDIRAVRTAGCDHFGVNVFADYGGPGDAGAVRAYAERLGGEARRAGVALGEPRHDDDGLGAKLALLVDERVAVVSFTFGLPPAGAIDALHEAGSEVWLTVTSPREARLAADAGADVLVVQGVEAGGHRGVFVDDGGQSQLTLLAALQLVRAEVDLPLVASGAIATGAAVAAVLVAGASAAQIGTAFLCTPEAGTSQVQRAATMTATPTVLTRAFSGRTARAIANRFHAEYGEHAPSAYPEVHHLTSPLRAHGRAVGDAGVINLWAGQAHALTEEIGAQELTRRLAADARAAVAAWAEM